MLGLAFKVTLQNQVTEFIDARAPAGLDHIGTGLLGDDCRAFDGLPGLHRIPVIERGVTPLAIAAHRYRCQ